MYCMIYTQYRNYDDRYLLNDPTIALYQNTLVPKNTYKYQLFLYSVIFIAIT